MNTCPYCGFDGLAAGAAVCPRCQSDLSVQVSSAEQERGTRLESATDIRRWVEPQAGAAVAQVPPRRSQADTAIPYRPLHRPPMALLCVLDDGQQDGQWVRIRSDELLVGRTEGDVTIPHDSFLSAAHFKIYRTTAKNRMVWRVKDVGSTNGTFARVASAVLREGQEFLVGNHRFRFEKGTPARPEGAAGAADSRGARVTQEWQVLSASELGQELPAIVEIAPAGPGQRVSLVDSEQWIGSDAARCRVGVPNDAFVSPRHARVFVDHQGRWHIEDCKSRNGTWLRIREITVRTTAELQAGEQRFLVKVLGGEDQTAG